MTGNSEKTVFAMSSITYAAKAQSILRQNGYGCEVIRTPKDLSKGCGYSIKVIGSREGAASLLSQAGIVIKAVKAL